jgi:holo-[acyl-carrier protein] synthase
LIGIDIIKISRIDSLIERFGKRGLRRFLSENEIDNSRGKTSRIAGYWSVKEAISKALGVGIGANFSFHDVEIAKDSLGRPVAILNEKIKEKFNISDIAISITHDGEYAVAVATITSTS